MKANGKAIVGRYLRRTAGACLVPALAVWVPTASAEGPRGVTVEPPEPAVCVGAEPAQLLAAGAVPAPRPTPGYLLGPDTLWVPTDSVQGWTLLPPRRDFWINYDSPGDSLGTAPGLDGLLTQSARAAVQLAPQWLQRRLADNLRRLSTADQDEYGSLVTDCHDKRFVDEVAFQVSHLSPQTLSRVSSQLLVANVELMYQIAPELSYVDIADYGDPITGGDYYSTTRYRTIEAGDTVEVEIPREIYYWWIVMPKLSDEEPTMDQTVYGYFWREYLYYFNDPGYPLLKEKLAPTQVLWDAQVHHLPGSREFADSMFALDVLGNWVSKTVPYPASGNRPIQPNVIAHEHDGNCGEIQDLLGAACRTALIPVALTNDINEDHVWDEFWWGEQWHPYQVDLGGGSTHIDDPYIAYDREHGGGKEVSAVWDWRGDGYQWSVVGRYSDVCSLTVAITDQAGLPVDGVIVQIHSEMWGSAEVWPGFYGATDRLGAFTTALGDSQNYYLRIESALGNHPSSGVVKIIDTAEAVPGSHFLWQASLPSLMPTLPAVPADPPDALPQLQLSVAALIPEETVYGVDCYNQSYDNVYARRFPVGYVSFFLTSEAGFADYVGGSQFDAFNLQELTSAPSAELVIPDAGSSWYAVLGNQQSLVMQRAVDYVAYLSDNRSPSEGGPDEWGYRWANSGVEGGPVFDWMDISAVGTELALGDDDNQGPLSLGFSFPYYGTTYDSVRICSNGWLSFVSAAHSYQNTPIPDDREPNALVAALWTDLDPSEGGSVIYHSEPVDGEFVVSWLGVPRYSGTGVDSFQVVLQEDGTVVLQYDRVSSWDGDVSCTVGIESPDGSAGLQYFLDGSPHENQLRDQLAVRFSRSDYDAFPDRVHSPPSTLFPGSSATPSLTVRSLGLCESSFDVVCSIAPVGDGQAVYTDSAKVEGMSYLEQRQVVFPSTWVAELPGDSTLMFYRVSFRTTLASDQHTANDTLERVILVSTVADLAHDDGSAETWYMPSAGVAVPKAVAASFDAPGPEYAVLYGKIFVDDAAPFDMVYLCPSDTSGKPDLGNWYACDSAAAAAVPEEWVWVSLPYWTSGQETMWLVATWDEGAVAPLVGVDIDAPVDERSWYGRPDLGVWVPYDDGDLMLRLQARMSTPAEDQCDPWPYSVRLSWLRPNPVRADATIQYSVGPGRHGTQRHVSLRVYDALGRLVAVPADHYAASGTYTLRWTPESCSTGRLPAGMYVLRLVADGPMSTDARRLVIVR